jgi:hypothetical protein
MPVILDDIFPTSELTLPVSQAKVTAKYHYTMDEGEKIAAAGERQGLMMALFAIRDWDVTDQDGTLLPITDENVGRLPSKDVGAILTWLTKRITKETEKDSQMEKQAEQTTPPIEDQPVTA